MKSKAVRHINLTIEEVVKFIDSIFMTLLVPIEFEI